MASNSADSTLLARSVLVTGTHYSMTTLVGRLVAASGAFHLLHEPANAQPTLSYASIKPARWYEYYDAAQVGPLLAFLDNAIRGEGLGAELARRAASIRSPRHAVQLARFVQRTLPMRLVRKPAVIKDPFLIFSAHSLQQAIAMRVVLTVRHPCAFAESFIRAGKGFDFGDLLQPALLDTIPQEAKLIEQFARTPADLPDQAAALWRIIYGYAARYLVPHHRTLVIRQPDLIENTQHAASELLDFCEAGGTASLSFDRFLKDALGAHGTDFAPGQDYVRRNGRATLDKWRRRLQQDMIGRIRINTEEVAQQFGFGGQDWQV